MLEKLSEFQAGGRVRSGDLLITKALQPPEALETPRKYTNESEKATSIAHDLPTMGVGL